MPTAAVQIFVLTVLAWSMTPALALDCDARQEAYCGLAKQGHCKLDRGNISLHLNFSEMSGTSCRGERCDPAKITSALVNISEKTYRWFSVTGDDFSPIYGIIDIGNNNSFFAQSELGLMFGKCN